MITKEETSKALDASIEKWEKNLRNAQAKWDSLITLGGMDCPLCRSFLLDDAGEELLPDDQRCRGCPVYEKTKLIGCAGTPYDDVSFLMEDEPDEEDEKSQELWYEELVAAVEDELNFLKSLK